MAPVGGNAASSSFEVDQFDTPSSGGGNAEGQSQHEPNVTYQWEKTDDGNSNVTVTVGVDTVGGQATGVFYFNGVEKPAAFPIARGSSYTFNQNDSSNATYNNQQGIYTKIGRLCFVRGDININVLGTGSANTLSGLPFSGNYQGTPQGAVNVMYYSNVSSNYLWMSGYILNNSTSIYFTGNNSSATTIQLNSSNIFTNNARVLFSATYTVD